VLAVGSTGVGSSTKFMVEAVAARLAAEPLATRARFEQIRRLVRSARSAIEAGDLVALGAALSQNQVVLAELALSTPEIERMCAVAAAAGALGAKLTGAGGGGSVVALVDSPERGAAVVAAWGEAGFGGFVSRVRGQPESASARSIEVAP
jgi:mevalonate kinase